MEDKNIEDKVKEHVEKLNQRIKTVKSNVPKKVETTKFEKLQKKEEELEGEIKKVQDKSQEGGSWIDITDLAENRAVKLIEKSLVDRANEEKE